MVELRRRKPVNYTYDDDELDSDEKSDSAKGNVSVGKLPWRWASEKTPVKGAAKRKAEDETSEEDLITPPAQEGTRRKLLKTQALRNNSEKRDGSLSSDDLDDLDTDEEERHEQEAKKPSNTIKQLLSDFAFNSTGKVRLSSTERVKPRRNAIRITQEPSGSKITKNSRKDYAYSDSSDNDSESEEPLEPVFDINTAFVENRKQVDKVIARRSTADCQNEFLLKYFNSSYRDAEWVPETKAVELAERKIQAYFRKENKFTSETGFSRDEVAQSLLAEAQLEERIKIDRIVSKRFIHNKIFYLVKWKGLDYENLTWMSECNVKEDDIQHVRRFEERQCGMRNMIVPSSRGKDILPDFCNGRQLRDYQQEGVLFLLQNARENRNSLLGDEMGLGKTAQSIALLECLRIKLRLTGPFLVVAPVSTLEHWRREFETWTTMHVLLYTGSEKSRRTQREIEFQQSASGGGHKFHVIIMSFETLRTDIHMLETLKFQHAVVDEAHRLKELKSAARSSLMRIHYNRLLLLSGTPIQNNTRELFSLLNLLDTVTFSDEDEFLAEYGAIESADQVANLQKLIKPYLLRRLKEDVEKELPIKEEIVVWVALTRTQKELYSAIYEKNASILRRGPTNNLSALRNVAMELRKVCNHPGLIGKGDVTFGDRQAGKLLLLEKLVPKLVNEGHKILIFSQFVIMLDILHEFLENMGYQCERIDGNVPMAERQASIDRFSNEDHSQIFLLSTRSGGLGITLTSATRCIIYDSDWNPQNDLQAMARCHRIGQTKEVRVYRLVTKDTYEQELFKKSSLKYGLDEAVLGRGDFTKSKNSAPENSCVEDKGLNSKAINDLLKKGAYHILCGKTASAEDELGDDMDIDKFLENQSETRTLQPKGGVEGPTRSTFAVASCEFKPTEGDDFWDKMLQGWQKEDAEQQFEKPSIRSCKRKVDYRLFYSDSRKDRDEDFKEDSKDPGAKKDRRKAKEKEFTLTSLRRLERQVLSFGGSKLSEAAAAARLGVDAGWNEEIVGRVAAFFWKMVEEEAKGTFYSVVRGCLMEHDIDPSKLDNCSLEELVKSINQPECETLDNKISSALEMKAKELKMLERLPDTLVALLVERLRRPIAMKEAQKIIQGHVEFYPKLKNFAETIDACELSIVQTMAKPESWWSRADDINLVRGIVKHGWGNVNMVLEDPEFVYSTLPKRGGKLPDNFDKGSETFRYQPTQSSLKKRLDNLFSYEVDEEKKKEFIKNQENISQKLAEKKRRETENRTRPREGRASKVAREKGDKKTPIGSSHKELLAERAAWRASVKKNVEAERRLAEESSRNQTSSEDQQENAPPNLSAPEKGNQTSAKCSDQVKFGPETPNATNTLEDDTSATTRSKKGSMSENPNSKKKQKSLLGFLQKKP